MDGEDQPATSQMSEMDTLLNRAQEEAMPLVDWALTPMGHYNPKEEYANVIASTNHQQILCFVTGPTLAWLPKPIKSFSDFLNGVESTLGTQPSLGLRMTLESLGLSSKQAGLTERACRSPTRLTDASANSRAVF